MEDIRLKCLNCGDLSAPFRCSRCHRAHYCTAKCQQTHWKSHHKDLCNKPPPKTPGVGTREDRLLLAASYCNLEGVQSSLDEGALVDSVGPGGATALFITAQYGFDGLMQFLLSKGANPNHICSETGATPIIMAAQNGHGEVALGLLAAGVDPNCRVLSIPAKPSSSEKNTGSSENKGKKKGGKGDGGAAPPKPTKPAAPTAPMVVTPMEVAVHNGHADIVSILLSSGAFFLSDMPLTMLYVASQKGHADVVKVLIRAMQEYTYPISSTGHANAPLYTSHAQYLNHSCTSGYTALMAATISGHTEIIIHLIDRGSDPNTYRDDGVTALIAAILMGAEAVVHALVKGGADVSMPVQLGSGTGIGSTERPLTPLLAAMKVKQDGGSAGTGLVSMLILAGAV